MAVGLPLGILMGRMRIVEYVLDPYVSFLYALPHVALVPLMVSHRHHTVVRPGRFCRCRADRARQSGRDS
ncbi:MAG: ABC transporter permease subunit [Chloroflexota bacterium]